VLSFVLALALVWPVSLVASAQSSNELVVYSTIFAAYAEAMKREFEARNPGVTVHVINPGGTEAMMARLLAERNNPRADVMHSGGSTEYAFAKAQGLLAPVEIGDIGIPEYIELGTGLLPTRDEEGFYYSWAAVFSGIMVNTERLRQLRLPTPTSYADLANPVYKGHIISPNPLRSSTAVTNVLAVLQAYGREEGWALLDKINQNIAFYVDSTANTYTLVARGEYPIAIGVNRPVYELQAEGWPVAFIYPKDGTMVQDNAMGMVNGARNPELAKKFIEFILSEEMQRIAGEYLYSPIRPGVLPEDAFVSLDNLKNEIDTLLLPDAELAEALRPEIQAKFEAYMRQR